MFVKPARLEAALQISANEGANPSNKILKDRHTNTNNVTLKQQDADLMFDSRVSAAFTNTVCCSKKLLN